MKTKIFLFAVLFSLLSCSPADQFYGSKSPLVIVAISKKGSVTVINSNNEYITIPHDYYLAETLSNSYSVGDTILFLK